MPVQTRALALITTLAMTGCAQTRNADLGATAGSTAEAPRAVQQMPRIESTLACIRDSGALKETVFVVGPFADSTGKINSVAAGATGAYVPQGGSAAYITDALARAGARVVSTYFGPPTKPTEARYVINGIFNSLDFAMPNQADLRVAGIGPIVNQGWAQLSLTIQLDHALTRINHQISMIQRPVRYSQVGAGIGHNFGGTLVTGSLASQVQERLQFEALNGPIALGVIDVITREFQQARQACRSGVEDLLSGGTQTQDKAPDAKVASRHPKADSN